LWCDAREFERRLEAGDLEAALELYRGELLQGFLLDGASELLDWLAVERSRLRLLASGAAWRLAGAREAAGEPGSAADWGRRALALDAQNESLVRQLMELLERVGDRAGAIRTYEAYAERLAAELELAPSAATRALAESLRERELAPPSPPAPPASVTVEPQAGIRVPAPAGKGPPPTPAQPGSIAVLPFVSMSASPDDAFFSDGLTDEIITTLAKLEGVRVASRTSSFVYKGRAVDIRTIGQERTVATAGWCSAAPAAGDAADRCPGRFSPLVRALTGADGHLAIEDDRGERRRRCTPHAGRRAGAAGTPHRRARP
jgi:serine/threonine-protein kinase